MRTDELKAAAEKIEAILRDDLPTKKASKALSPGHILSGSVIHSI